MATKTGSWERCSYHTRRRRPATRSRSDRSLGLVVSDSASLSATPATPDNETLTDTGYELNDTDTVTVERQFTVAGRDRTVVVNNPQRVYHKPVAVGNRTVTGGVFATASTPAINVAGSPRNPIAEESHRELLGRFQSNLGVADTATVENVTTHEAVMLGSQTTVTQFETNLSVDGERREFAIYVTTARAGGDIVVAIGGHPTAFADERVAIMRLIYAVEAGGR
ncbi:hypothetical protein EGD98_03495 [Halomicroarcula sp. F24A]|uniref:Uncharacterized protein n=1 Tax=Haloarcula salinisoli TaxID=2487746 RepID=A0A8J7YG35_9EURY|nr:hypothetical protein [Halomicroarcula salinisoli]